MKFKGILIGEASGSVGSNTFSHNAGGQYVRQRAVPVDPGTAQQQAVRGFLSLLTSAWLDTLTQLQRDAWATYAVNVPLSDTLGEPRNIGAIAQYVRSNVSRLQAGLARIDDAPTTFNLGSFTNPTLDSLNAATEGLTIGFTATDAWANEAGSAMLVYGSRALNQSINFFKGPYRFAGLVAGDATTPPVSPATITNPFPFGTANKVFVQIRFTRADGRLSSPFRLGGTA